MVFQLCIEANSASDCRRPPNCLHVCSFMRTGVCEGVGMLTLVAAFKPALPCQGSAPSGFLNTSYGWQMTLIQDVLSVSCAVNHWTFQIWARLCFLQNANKTAAAAASTGVTIDFTDADVSNASNTPATALKQTTRQAKWAKGNAQQLFLLFTGIQQTFFSWGA